MAILKEVNLIDGFVEDYKFGVAQELRESGRALLARNVSALPKNGAFAAELASKDLPQCTNAYALSSAAQCAASLRQSQWKEALRHADIAMTLLGLPQANIFQLAVKHAAGHMRSSDEMRNLMSPTFCDETKVAPTCNIYKEHCQKYESCQCFGQDELDVKTFKERFFDGDIPVTIRGVAASWLAVKLWCNPNHLDKEHGFRTVPVEVSKGEGTRRISEQFLYIRDVLNAMI